MTSLVAAAIATAVGATAATAAIITQLVISAYLTIASTLYQRNRAAKAAANAAELASAQKGIQQVVESQMINLPVVYGRNKVGGARVFHCTHGVPKWPYDYHDSTVFEAKYAAKEHMAPGGIEFLSTGDVRSRGHWNTTGVPIESISIGAFTLAAHGTIKCITSIPPILIQLEDFSYDDPPMGWNESGPPETWPAGGAFNRVWITHKPLFQPNSDNPINFDSQAFCYSIDSSGTTRSATPVGAYESEYTKRAMCPDSIKEEGFGGHNELLFIQQVLSVGGLNDIVWVDIDEKSFDDASFGMSARLQVYPNSDGTHADPLIVCNYPQGVRYGTSDNPNPLLDRSNAKFPHLAYATGYFYFKRDDPQYSGIPAVQFYTEGIKLRTVTNGVLSQDRIYFDSNGKTVGNNPAWVILDYLLDAKYGKGVAEHQVDLPSFEKAAKICARRVQIVGATTGSGNFEVPVSGKFWKRKDAQNIKRYIQLYEANLAVDTKTAVLDNLETLLETMGLAELLWSAGKYRLSLSYPTVWKQTFDGTSLQPLSNEEITLGSTHFYTPDEVVQYEYNPADVGTRDLYKCTSKTTNRPANSSGICNAGWTKGPGPDVVSAYLTDDDIVLHDTIAMTYPSSQSRLNYCTVKFLNENKDFAEDTISWPPKYNVAVEHSGDNFKGEWQKWNGSVAKEYQPGNSVVYHGVYYKLGNPQAPLETDEAKAKGYDTPEIDSNWMREISNEVYQAFLDEDGGLFLEKEIFQSGDTTVYHAMATAEERVRTSRGAIVYKITVDRTFIHLEPGDFVKIQSDALGITGELTRVEELTVNSHNNIELQLTKFDARQLAWNARDNDVVPPQSVYTKDIPQVTNLVFDAQAISIEPNSCGLLTWTPPNDARISKYGIKVATVAASILDLEWQHVGYTTDTFFSLPQLASGQCLVTVVAMSTDSLMAPRYNATTGSQWPILRLDIVDYASIDGFLSHSSFNVATNYDGSIITTDSNSDGILDCFVYAAGDFIIKQNDVDMLSTTTLPITFTSSLDPAVAGNHVVIDESGHFQVMSMSDESDSFQVEFIATLPGKIFKQYYTVNKSKSGSDAVQVGIQGSTSLIMFDANGNLVPNQVLEFQAATNGLRSIGQNNEVIGPPHKWYVNDVLKSGTTDSYEFFYNVNEDMPELTFATYPTAGIKVECRLVAVAPHLYPGTYSAFQVVQRSKYGNTGTAGVNAPMVNLNSASYVMPYNVNGSRKQTTDISLDCDLLGGLADKEIAWSVNSPYTLAHATTAAGTVQTPGTHLNSLVIPTTYNPAYPAATITATHTAGLYADTITIIQVKDGEQALSGFLTNESMVLAGDSSGHVTEYGLPATGHFKVYYGSVEVTASCNFELTDTFGGNSSLTLDNTLNKGKYEVTLMEDATAIMDATIRATYTVNSGLMTTLSIDKVLTVAKSKNGVSAITGYLTNESITISANADGVVASADYASTITGEFKVLNGSTAVTATSYTSDSSLVTISGTGAYSYSTGSMASDTVNITLTAVYGGVTLAKLLTISKVRSASSLVLSSTSQIISYNASGTNPSPSSTIAFTATAKSLINTSGIVWLLNGSDTGSRGLTYNYSVPASYSGGSATVECRLDNYGTIYSDTITVVQVKSGATGATGNTGATGSTGATGTAGTTGDSAVNAYRSVAIAAADPATPSTGTSNPPSGWSSTVPAISAGYRIWYVQGVKNGVSGSITWSAPMWNTFAVNSLSAITANLGVVTVNDYVNIGAYGNLYSGGDLSGGWTNYYTSGFSIGAGNIMTGKAVGSGGTYFNLNTAGANGVVVTTNCKFVRSDIFQDGISGYIDVPSDGAAHYVSHYANTIPIITWWVQDIAGAVEAQVFLYDVTSYNVGWVCRGAADTSARVYYRIR